jgi:DNA-binding NarL/FixJ family response regulator
MSNPIKVSLIEDDEGLRESLSTLINRAPGLRCAYAYATAEEALKRVPLEKPDVLLVDINLPGMNGIECVRALKGTCSEVQMLMLTMYEDGDQVFQSLTAGASGYVLKRTAPEEILRAIQEVHAGGSPMSRQIARKVVNYFQSRGRVESELEMLTKREQEILAHLAKGFLYKEIADALGISIETVRDHIRNVYQKLHVHSRSEAIVKFLKR